MQETRTWKHITRKCEKFKNKDNSLMLPEAVLRKGSKRRQERPFNCLWKTSSFPHSRDEAGEGRKDNVLGKPARRKDAKAQVFRKVLSYF